MRAILGSLGLVWLLSPAAAEAERPPSAEVDLGAATLERRELSLGLVRAQYGATRWLTVGSFTLPWGVMIYDPASQVVNAYAKAGAPIGERLAASFRLGLVWARLDDLDGDGLDARARLLTTNTRLAAELGPRWALTGELTWVFAQAAAERLDEADTEVAGVAIANTGYVGLGARRALSRRLTLWIRGRLLLDHAPVIAEGQAQISPRTRIEARARADGAELSTAGSVTAGVLATFGRLNLRVGVGYGHWIVPMVELPVGRNLPSVDLDIYWRL